MVCFAWSGYPQYAARCVGAFARLSCMRLPPALPSFSTSLTEDFIRYLSGNFSPFSRNGHTIRMAHSFALPRIARTFSTNPSCGCRKSELSQRTSGPGRSSGGSLTLSAMESGSETSRTSASSILTGFIPAFPIRHYER